jgi:TonB family protein
VVVVGLIASAILSKPRVDVNQKPIQAKLLRLGKPRDEKLLPRKEEPPPPPPQEVKAVEAPKPVAEPPPPQPAAVPIAVPDAKPVPKAEKQDGVNDSDQRRKSLFSAFSKASKSAPQEELEGAEDGDPLGDAARAEGERYWGILTAQVRRHYDVSQTIPDDERIRLRARVVLKLSRTGQVVDVDLSKTSGNALFDNAVLSAVKKASPFSPPPEAVRDLLGRDGVEMEFTP